jgi:hypothetical protein
MNAQILDQLLSVAMERYDAMIRSERDPQVKALLLRDRSLAMAAARKAITSSMLERAPSPSQARRH